MCRVPYVPCRRSEARNRAGARLSHDGAPVKLAASCERELLHLSSYLLCDPGPLLFPGTTSWQKEEEARDRDPHKAGGEEAIHVKCGENQ